MKNLIKISVLICLFSFQSINAQNTDKELSLDKGTISEQFEFIKKKSSNYQNYKVVKRVWLSQLEKHIADSLQAAKKRFIAANEQILAHQETIDKLKTELEFIKTDLAKVNEAKDSINFFGKPMQKSVYKISVWTVIILLLMVLSYFIYCFKNSNDVTKKTLLKHDELEKEYNTYRTRALEREQVLNRKLQDEINKQKKS